MHVAWECLVYFRTKLRVLLSLWNYAEELLIKEESLLLDYAVIFSVIFLFFEFEGFYFYSP